MVKAAGPVLSADVVPSCSVEGWRTRAGWEWGSRNFPGQECFKAGFKAHLRGIEPR